jgi:hypothetical protein
MYLLLSVSAAQLQFLFCRRFHCDTSEFEERALRECLYWHARLLAPLLRKVQPHFFDKDLKFIRYLGATTDWDEAKTDINNFYLVNVGKPSFARTDLRLRVSGRKASRLARELFPTNHEGRAAATTTL